MTYMVRIEKGRYIYLYECRSVRVAGKENPVSDRIFIGRVDTETREFIPKRYYVHEVFDIERSEYLKGPHRLPRVPRCYEPLAGITS